MPPARVAVIRHFPRMFVRGRADGFVMALTERALFAVILSTPNS